MSEPLPLRDAIDIPEHVSDSDYVLQLHAGVEAAEQTLTLYEVTEPIAEAFDEALGEIGSALASGMPKGAFIHGEFGSGKSHFMAVLHLLLTGNPTARAKKGLQQVVAKHEATLAHKFLAIDYHLLDKQSIEAAVFSGYLATVRELHPGVALPVLHRSDALIDDARRLRARIGDEAFFAGLGSSGGGIPGLGTRVAAAVTWDGAQFDAAASASDPTDPVRVALVRSLMDSYFRSAEDTGTWLDMSVGLTAMTDHAKSLGYEGVVLFLDELVLWLAQRLSDPAFIAREVAKISKLVETESAHMAVPIVSFIARQRDLKDFIGDAGTGAEKVGISQNFSFFEGRFTAIRLPATDLPVIVNRRLLQPKDEAGATALHTAFTQVKANRAAWSALLTDESRSDEAAFELVYPFSPALVDSLIALSSLLQRNRTALKVLALLLSRGRDELTVGDVIPAGDVFDIVVLEEKALSAEMEQRFDVARRFYRDKMRPLLLAEEGLEERAVKDLPRYHSFRNKDRLLKTLLMAAIVPEATSLKNLTAGRLAALNYGSVRAMLPGQEASQVLGWVRSWQRQYPEIAISTGADPIISVTLAGVDYESVVTRVETADSVDARKQLLRNMLADELGLPAQVGLLTGRRLSHVWRGGQREVDVEFGNVRDAQDLREDQLLAAPGRWKVVIDYPFDETDYTPADDFARLDRLVADNVASDTIAWIPYFFTKERMDTVGRLVILEHLFAGSHFDENASHLPVASRGEARRFLENQRDALREDIRSAMRQAYGIAAPNSANVSAEQSEHRIFASLRPGLALQKPNAATLRDALTKVLDATLADQYPKHPEFEPSGTPVTRRDASSVLEAVREAVSKPTGRLEQIDRSRAALLRRVASPLKLAVAGENHLAVSWSTFGWRDDFGRWAVSEAGPGGEVRVGALRAHLTEFGMSRDVEDLLLLTWAALDDREFRRYNARVPEPAVGGLADDIDLRPPVLPEPGQWEAAKERAAALFGIRGEHRLSASAVGRLAGDVRSAVRPAADPCNRLVGSLRRHAATLGIDLGSAEGRLGSAIRGAALVGTLASQQDDTALLVDLAEADLPAEPQALAKSISSAGEVASVLAATRWDEIETASHAAEGSSLLEKLAEVAAAEELHSSLIPVVQAVSGDAHQIVLKLAAGSSKPSVVAPPTPEPEPTTPDDVRLVLVDDTGSTLDLETIGTRLRAFAKTHPGRRIRVTWRAE